MQRQQMEAAKLQMQIEKGLLGQAMISNGGVGGALGRAQADTGSTIMRNLQMDISQMRREMAQLKGFYEWMIHAYPETIAQYKALMDLQRASNPESGEEQAYAQNAKSAI
jgi:hypothetical protein